MGAAAGVLSTKRERELKDEKVRLQSQAEVVDLRTSDALKYNADLVSAIDELRRERSGWNANNNSFDAKEKTMAADMHGFASGAHSALDEKERVSTRLRRLRHEYSQEVSLHDVSYDEDSKLIDELRAKHAELEAEDERIDELQKRLEFQAMRKRRDTQVLRVARRACGASRCKAGMWRGISDLLSCGRAGTLNTTPVHRRTRAHRHQRWLC